MTDSENLPPNLTENSARKRVGTEEGDDGRRDGGAASAWRSDRGGPLCEIVRGGESVRPWY